MIFEFHLSHWGRKMFILVPPAMIFLCNNQKKKTTVSSIIATYVYLPEPGDSLTVQNHEMRLHEINTLEWNELVAADPNMAHGSSGGMSLPFP